MASAAASLSLHAPDLLEQVVAAWPSPAARAIARQLARADEAYHDEAPDEERAVLALLGIDAPGGGSPPLAGVTAAYDLGAAAPGVVRADPVYLRADVARVVLFDAGHVGLAAAEADALIELLNASFAGDGLVFRRGRAAHRWYLELPQAPLPGGASPERLAGAVLEPDVAERRGLGELRRFVTEVQMLLHDCAVNDARAAAGQPPINGVWLWGAGELPGAVAPPAFAWGADDLLAACAAHAGVPHDDDPAALAHALARPPGAVVARWPRGAAGSLEELLAGVIEPAAAALAAGRLARLVIDTAHAELVSTRGSRWRVWRNPARWIAGWQTRLAAAQAP
ncbi:MAG: hypothetical protein RLW61_21605 [Gammaproteobacteria bacterium]